MDAVLSRRARRYTLEEVEATGRFRADASRPLVARNLEKEDVMHERPEDDSYKESIWEATCKCGEKTRVDLRGQSGDQVVRIGCEDHWFELPAEDLRAALATSRT